MIGIGFIHRIGGCVTYEGAGLWYASLDEFNSNLKAYKFSNREELENSLDNHCKGDLEKHAKPLWADQLKLRHLIDAQRMERQLQRNGYISFYRTIYLN